MERMEFDLLFRWFVGLGADEPVWDASTFSKNRERLLEGDVAARFLATLIARPRVKRLLSSDHFSVDGTMIQAWSSMKSVKPIWPGEGPGDEPPPSSGARNAEADFHGETRSNATHASTTDPEARLYKKGARHGGPARLPRPRADGEPLRPRRRRLPDAGERPRRASRRSGDDREACGSAARHHAGRGQEPPRTRPGLRHVRLRERAALDETCARTWRSVCADRPSIAAPTRHLGYGASQRIRKRIEEAFGWMKTIGGMRRPMRRGAARTASDGPSPSRQLPTTW